MTIIVAEHIGSKISREELSVSLVRSACAAIVGVDNERRIIGWNRAAEELYGWTAIEAIGRSIAILLPPEGDDVAVDARVREGLANGESMTVDVTRMRKDGSRVEVALSIAPMRDRSGAQIGACAVVHDIGPARRQEAALRERLFLYERAEEVAHVGSWAFDVDSGDLSWSAESYRIFGRPQGSPIPPDFLRELVHADDRAEIAGSFEGALERDEPYAVEFRALRPDGTERWVHARGSVARHADGRPMRFVGINFDVTEQRRAMAALAASEHRYRTIVETTTQGVWTIDREGRTTFVNGQMAKMLGCAPADALGRAFTDFIADDKVAEAREQLAERNEGISARASSQLRRVDGRILDVVFDAAPLVDDDGAGVGALAMIYDVTEQKAQATILAQREEELRQAQKMEAIGSLAGGIAHDFNNLLTVILSYSSLILDECDPTSPMREDMEEVKRAGERASDLTAQLLAFSRRQVLQPGVHEIDRVILDLEKMLRRLLGEDVALTLNASSQARVLADRGQLEQVVVNLAVNARDAMSHGGTLTVETSITALGPDSAALRGVAPGDFVRIVVRDTGCGMDAATRGRMFEPFFTTKERGKGTGLGLSTVFGIVKQSGGAIDVESRVGIGTTFEILLPRSDRATEAPRRSHRPMAARGTETILLVEDDDQVRTVLCNVLRRLGYTIIDARNAGEALLVCEQVTEPIHLMISDVVMPRMTGPQLAERVAKLRPEMRTLFMSGYTDNDAVREAVCRGTITLLPKPTTPDTVARTVRETLDRPRA